MNRETCKHKDCKKQSISFSEFCGEHSDPVKIVEALNSLKKGEYKNICIQDINLIGIELNKITFKDIDLLDVEIDDSIFNSCTFYNGKVVNTYFGTSQFKNCQFNNFIEIQSSHFSSCHLDNTRFIEAKINQTSFQEATKLEDCLFDDVNLIGTLLDEIDLQQVKFIKTGLNQSSVNRCLFNQVNFQSSSIYKTTFWDCWFNNSVFQNIQNDFDELENSIELCLLNNTRFINTYTPERINRWNGINVSANEFYAKVIEQIWADARNLDLEYIDNLSALEVAVKRLDQIDKSHEYEKRQVTNIFATFFNLAKEQKDLRAFGKLADYISRIPKEWLVNINQFLPSPSQIPSESTLRLVFNTNDLSLEKASRIFDKLNRLEKLYKRQGEAKLKNLEIGSITIEIGSNIQLIMLIVLVLYRGANFFLDSYGKYLGHQNTKLENEKLKLEIAELKKKQTDEKDNPAELTALKKQNAVLQEQVLKLSQRNFDLLKEKTGIQPEELISDEVREEALQLGELLSGEADTLDLYANIIETDMRAK